MARDWLRHEAPKYLDYPIITDLQFRFGVTLDEACALAAEAYNRRRGRSYG
ncbi:MAG: hypothetical protein AB1440_05545 [Pseudomonadota bacterium]